MAAKTKKVSPGQVFEINGEQFKVVRLAGKEARMIRVGTKPDEAVEVTGSLKYRRLATLERMLDEQKPARRRGRKAAAEPVAEAQPGDVEHEEFGATSVEGAELSELLA